jgi:TPR repeat protein
MLEFGRQLMDGEHGDNKDEEAALWLEAACSKGNIEAHFLLGLLLRTSETLAVDKSETILDKHSPKSPQSAKDVMQIINAAKAQARVEKKKRQKGTVTSDQKGSKNPVSFASHGRKLIIKAARASHGKAMVYMGNLLLEEADALSSNEPSSSSSVTRAGSILEAKLWYERAAQLNPPQVDALFNLGMLLYEGRKGALQVDLSASLANFTRAAELGDMSAQFWLGHLHCSGEANAPLNPRLGLDYMQRAAAAGHEKAWYYIATIFRSGLESESSCVAADAEQFESHLEKALAVEDADAYNCLAGMYLHGCDGRQANAAKAREYFDKAVELGSVEAAVSLGAIFYNGIGGVAKDARRAFELYNKAAEGGSKEAWKNLAIMYSRGDGVPKSTTTAAEIMKVVFGVDASKAGNVE